jgi:hypothetical protein
MAQITGRKNLFLPLTGFKPFKLSSTVGLVSHAREGGIADEPKRSEIDNARSGLAIGTARYGRSGVNDGIGPSTQLSARCSRYRHFEPARKAF